MPATVITQTMANLLTSTMYAYWPTLQEQIWDEMPLLDYLDRKGNRTTDTGYEIRVPVEYATNGTVAWHNPTALINMTDQEILTQAKFDWAMVSGSVVISDADAADNSGENRILKLLEAKLDNLKMSLRNQINTSCFTGTGVAPNMTGLIVQVAILPTTGTVGGIDRSTNAWWQNQYQSVGSFAANGRTRMTHMYNLCSKGATAEHPDFIITDRTSYEYFELSLESKERLVIEKGPDDKTIGWEALKFKGATVTWDEACTSGYMYFLNSKFLKLVFEKGLDFNQTPFIRPVNQRMVGSITSARLNLISMKPQRTGVLYGITA